MGVIRDRAATRGHGGAQHTPCTLHGDPPLAGTPRSPCPSEDVKALGDSKDHQLAVSPGQRQGQWGHPDLGTPWLHPTGLGCSRSGGGGHEWDRVAGVACLFCYAVEHLGTAGLVWQMLSGEFGCTEARQQPPAPAVPSRLTHPRATSARGQVPAGGHAARLPL